MTDESLSAEVARYSSWYHTIDLGGGVVTPGWFDHRPHLDKYPIPADLTGLRCLDVGTMDGFFAFEMERRGAAEVVAVDVEGVSQIDLPASMLAKTETTMEDTKPARFALVHEALSSKVDRRVRSVYDLDDDMGTFDVVFCGDVICHLKDPVTALQRIREVCRGRAIIVTPVVRLRSRKPLAEFDGIDEFTWWQITEITLERMLRAVGFSRAELSPSFKLPTTGPDDWKGLRGVATGFV